MNLRKNFLTHLELNLKKSSIAITNVKIPNLKTYLAINYASTKDLMSHILKLLNRGFYTKYETIKEEVLIELLMIFDALTICPWSKSYINIPGGAAKLICEIRKVFNYKGEHK